MDPLQHWKECYPALYKLKLEFESGRLNERKIDLPRSDLDHDMPEPGIREQIIKILWQKQFDGSPWIDKFHLIRLDSLDADYGALADKIIAAVRADIEQCFMLVDRRSSGHV